ncbi:proline racemase family protein [Thalassomonas haliotis]|uniref:Proline racemase family protein n=1 Tax=Thalassomonas haliotis TaxID=485448 RepID=A0ABY7VAZ9_9GAMM|nr:proline racemase family protein [Thalassomonas haliotis]WDE10073.1 proline racemase family protein [Thalassomonas haliotis]
MPTKPRTGKENTAEKLRQWQPPEESGARQENTQIIETLECHTGGEPLRIITGGFPELTGTTVLEKRRNCRQHYDALRRALMFEPRGHADMYGAIITEPERENSHFGAIFIHNEGYSTMCGHAVIALAKCAVESGMVAQTGEVTQVVIDVPCGQIHARAFARGKVITRVSFDSVPAFVYAAGQSIFVDGVGQVNFDIAFGGAFYAYVQASSLGLELIPRQQEKLIACGRKIKAAIANKLPVCHPFESDLSFLYGVIFIDDSPVDAVHSRNVCIFADGELDRSPTGSGVSGRIALHIAKEQVSLNQDIIIESILGSQFTVRACEALDYDGYPAVIARVSGQAFVCGKAQWLINEQDPLKHGFLLRQS